MSSFISMASAVRSCKGWVHPSAANCSIAISMKPGNPVPLAMRSAMVALLRMKNKSFDLCTPQCQMALATDNDLDAVPCNRLQKPCISSSRIRSTTASSATMMLRKYPVMGLPWMHAISCDHFTLVRVHDWRENSNVTMVWPCGATRNASRASSYKLLCLVPCSGPILAGNAKLGCIKDGVCPTLHITSAQTMQCCSARYRSWHSKRYRAPRCNVRRAPDRLPLCARNGQPRCAISPPMIFRMALLETRKREPGVKRNGRLKISSKPR